MRTQSALSVFTATYVIIQMRKVTLFVLLLVTLSVPYRSEAGSYQGLWRGTTSQGLPITITVDSSDRIALVEMEYKAESVQVVKGENLSCVKSLRKRLNSKIEPDGTFKIESMIFSKLKEKKLDYITGSLSGSFAEGAGRFTGDWSHFFCDDKHTASKVPDVEFKIKR